MTKFTDEELFAELQNSRTPVCSSKEIADELCVTRQAVHKRLTNLEEAGQVKSTKLGRSVGWYISRGEHEVEQNNLKAKVRNEEGFKVDIIDDNNGADLLIQAGPNGYQLDLWWENEEGKSCQSNNWVRFGNQDRDYPHDNRHNRQPALTTDATQIVVIDPDPRVENIGYEGATIRVSRTTGQGSSTDIQGYLVELKWVDEYNEVHHEKAIAPLIDPRDEREKYYKVISQDMK